MIDSILQTRRTVLRLFTPDDTDALAAIFGSAKVMKYLGLDGKPIEREETETALFSIIKHWEQKNFGRWAVISKESNQLIGCAGFRSFEENVELFYILDEPYWGKGLATEIAAECIKFGFERRGFDQIIAFTRPENAASRNVLAKIEMKYDGEITIFGVDAVRYVFDSEDYKPQVHSHSVV